MLREEQHAVATRDVGLPQRFQAREGADGITLLATRGHGEPVEGQQIGAITGHSHPRASPLGGGEIPARPLSEATVQRVFVAVEAEREHHAGRVPRGPVLSERPETVPPEHVADADVVVGDARAQAEENSLMAVGELANRW